MEPRDAATVMLVRDAPQLEVFMLRRNLRSAFVAGAYVFPGGAVDADPMRTEEVGRGGGGFADRRRRSRRSATATNGGGWMLRVPDAARDDDAADAARHSVTTRRVRSG